MLKSAEKLSMGGTHHLLTYVRLYANVEISLYKGWSECQSPGHFYPSLTGLGFYL